MPHYPISSPVFRYLALAIDVWTYLALAINVHAMAALALGLRSRSADAMARYARRCVGSWAAFVLVVCGTVAAVVDWMGHYHFTPSTDRIRLRDIVAFTALVGVLPLIAAYVLRIRARRVRGKG